MLVCTRTKSASVIKVVMKSHSNTQNDENWNSLGFHVGLHWEVAIALLFIMTQNSPYDVYLFL
jgi:hypothetical protein